MKKRRIAVVTGTRAEYGLLAPVIAGLKASADVTLQLIVTGAHLSARHGLTVREIEKDGFKIAARVPLGESDASAGDTARAMARGVEGFSRAYAKLRPELVVVLGDRFEILAAAAAALPHRVPVAHIHGGESSNGAWDESVRHAVTKMSHLHFAAHPFYAKRLVRMGEDPKRVFAFGSPGRDRVAGLSRLSRAALENELGMKLAKPVILVAYHPATLSADRGRGEFRAILSALEKRRGTLIFSYPNADAGGAAVRADLEAFVRRHSGRAKAFPSLGQKRYFSVMAQADALVGNSSSGVLEAPYFALPAVNVGARQEGRLRERNVLDVPAASAAAIGRALDRALSPAFKRGLAALKTGGPSPSARIVRELRRVRLGDSLLKKRFHD